GAHGGARRAGASRARRRPLRGPGEARSAATAAPARWTARLMTPGPSVRQAGAEGRTQSPQVATPGIRTALAVLAGKAVGYTSRRLGRGGGTALPGVIAERIDPRIVERLTSRLRAPRVLVTGTNGKTTTARLLGSILRAAGQEPIRNGAGSNL